MEFLKSGDHHKNLSLLVRVLIIFLAILTISFAVGAWNKIKESKYIGQDIMIRNTISVIGTGETYVKPNLGVASFSVKTEGKTALLTMSENTKKMNSVIEKMKELGVEEKDLKTIRFQIYPYYEYIQERRVLTGYEATQSIQVKMRDLEKVGQIVEAAVNAGANQTDDLAFTVDDEERGKAEKEARENAIKEAKEQAKEIADQLGIGLVRIINFSENSYGPRAFESKEFYGIGGGGGSAPQIEAGENRIETTVYITYEIN